MPPSTSEQAFNNLQAFQSSAKNPADLLAQQQQTLGTTAANQNVQGLRGAVANTTRLLNNVAPGVMGRTGNSLVTSAQANRQIQNETAPIAQQLSQRTNDLGTAQQDYNTLQNQAQQAAELQYSGQQNQLSYMQNLYNTLYQKEADARKAAADEAARQEQIRQFNESLAAQREASTRSSAASYASPSFSTGSTPATPRTPVDPIKQKAQADVANLLTKDGNRIQQEMAAIARSAGYGNTYDQLKLQLLQAAGIKLQGQKVSNSAPLANAAAPTIAQTFGTRLF